MPPSPKSSAQMDDEENVESEAIRLKTLAEQKYNSSDLKSALKYAKRSLRLSHDLDGAAEMVTAFKILRAASKSTSAATPAWYKILQVEPFSHINTVKKQYKKLALTLHPDKSPFSASEEAFKLVGEAFRVLSDKTRRKEYDMKLRIALQAAAAEETAADTVVETFWTACSTCRLFHQFERRYLEHNLMCPSCKKSFKAIEVSVLDNNVNSARGGGGGGGGERMKTRNSSSAAVRVKFSNAKGKQKMNSVEEILKRAESKSMEISENVNEIGSLHVEKLKKNVDGNGNLSSGGGVMEGLRSKRVGESRTLDKNGEGSGSRVVVSERLKAKRANISEKSRTLDKNGEGSSSVVVVSERLKAKRAKTSENLRTLDKSEEGSSSGVLVSKRLKAKRAKISEEKMTLAEMQVLAKKKASEEKLKLKLKEKETEKSKENEKVKGTKGKPRVSRGVNAENEKSSSSSRNSKRVSESGDLEIMDVEDSDFYDFDKDRVERSFRKGQVWAIYDDDDGMPRHYGLIDDVVSVNPFEVKMNWLDIQNNVDEALMCWEKMGFHICCGRFKVSRKISVSVDSLNIFSHVVDCDRAARELYRIYPKKGSVWALCNENAMDAEGRNVVGKDKRCYDIVVFLTSYSEAHGLSMAYLEKVKGFKTVFKRKEIGSHAIKWIENDEVRMFSHQIPARKLSGEETSGIANDCWELDPASLPPELLTIGWK